jgi:large subunit ribosomal protein L10
VVKGGILGTKVLTAADAAALAEVPPREVLLARIAGGLAAPMVQFAGLLQALPRNFAYGLKALIDQRGGPEPAVAEAAPAAEDTTAETTTTDSPAETPAVDEAPDTNDATAAPEADAASDTETDPDTDTDTQSE